jgi:hypothetical protein
VARCDADGESTPVAQNMDLPAWLDGLQVLFDVSPVGDGSHVGPRALVPFHAGMIGLNALNEYGVGITVFQLPVSANGLPVAFVICLLHSTIWRRPPRRATDSPCNGTELLHPWSRGRGFARVFRGRDAPRPGRSDDCT